MEQEHTIQPENNGNGLSAGASSESPVDPGTRGTDSTEVGIGAGSEDGGPLLTNADTAAFDIELPESKLRVEPQNNGTYRIMEGETKLGVIYAQADGDQLVWETMDDLNLDFVQQIGELISEKHMGS